MRATLRRYREAIKDVNKKSESAIVVRDGGFTIERFTAARLMVFTLKETKGTELACGN